MKEKTITAETLTKSNIKNVPVREGYPSLYKHLLLVPSRRKHESGWTQIQVVGVKEDDSLELCSTYSDDLMWYVPQDFRRGGYESIRTDCYYPSGILKMWSNYFMFEVGSTMSSLEIKLVERKK